METNEKKQLKTHIQETIETLKADIESYKRLTGPIAPDNAIGRLTRMEAIGTRGINEAALRKAKSTLSRLERALPMIDDPDFGLCRECDQPIPFKRLMAIPEAELCVPCAEKLTQ